MAWHSVECATIHLGVVSSSPVLSVEITFKKILKILTIKIVVWDRFFCFCFLFLFFFIQTSYCVSASSLILSYCMHIAGIILGKLHSLF